MFNCGFGILIGLDALCNGVVDCLGAPIEVADETAVICDSKCFFYIYNKLC